MHIKSIILDGFKTYKDETIVEDLSPGSNIILGKNGTGKSNIFAAVQFVMSDKFSHMRSEDRQLLIHEGSGKAVMNASVELIFDNSDFRFPMEKRDEVSLKRTIGLKKDEYFWNNKHVTKQDVENLLESAGISRSNPYYIVEQGKVRKLIQMKDSERLELLKEIAGTRTYDTRRQESLKIMQETDARSEQINEVIGTIEERLAELGEEKEELAQFQSLDSDRRCLEYTVYDKELKLAEAKLADLEGGRETEADESSRYHSEAAAATEARLAAEDEIKSLQQGLTKYQNRVSELRTMHQEKDKDRTKMEIAEAQAKAKVKRQQEGQKRSEAELQTLETEIVTMQAQVSKITPAYEKTVAEERVLKQKAELLKAEQQQILARQGRSSLFGSKKERDVFLKKELTALKKTVALEQQQAKTLRSEIAALIKGVATKKMEVEAKRGEIEQIKQDVEKVSEEYNAMTVQRNEANDARKELWRKESQMESGVLTCKEELERAERSLQYSMDKNLYRGLQIIKRAIKEQKLQGVHGSLIELFTTEKNFLKCVETTAGNALFNVVVDNVDVARKVIEILKQHKAGRVTFMPLAQLHPKEIDYPKSSDVFPMIKKLKFDEKYTNAIQQVFANTLVTRSLEVAAQHARTHNLDAITLDGDQVHKKGALTGGFVDKKRSRLQAQMSIVESETKFRAIASESSAIKEEVSAIDQKVSQLLGEQQKLQNKRTHDRKLLETAQLAFSDLSKALLRLEEELAQKETTVANVDASVTQYTAKIEALEVEVDTELSAELSAAEKNQLQKLTAQLDACHEQLMKASSNAMSLETEITVLKTSLASNLLKRREELTLAMAGEEVTVSFEMLEQQQYELQALTDQLAEIAMQLETVEGVQEQSKKRLMELTAALEELKSKEDNLIRNVAQQSKAAERAVAQRSLYAKKKVDAAAKIRELGSLPAQAFAKYQNKTNAQLLSDLEKVNKKLSKFSHINKKAIDQYMSFTQEREDLLSRKAEQEKGKQAIIELIEHLDQQKDEAIQRTFKGIAKNFSQVFAQLVPGGKGTLVIHTTSQTDEGSEAEEEESEEEVDLTKKKGSKSAGKKKGSKRKRGADMAEDQEEEGEEGGKKSALATKHYTGVGIAVAFANVKQNMRQLSGGQQSVVALALIFAIQRCDPSPFYFFDEIDQALDAVYRTSVARMIAEQAKSATQFICTTFSPEMVQTGDKFFGVVFENKASLIKEISKEEAEQLILIVEKEK